MGPIGLPELIIIILIILLLFGAKKLPEIGKAIGKAIREFKEANKDIEKDFKKVEDNKDNQEPKKQG